MPDDEDLFNAKSPRMRWCAGTAVEPTNNQQLASIIENHSENCVSPLAAFAARSRFVCSAAEAQAGLILNKF